MGKSKPAVEAQEAKAVDAFAEALDADKSGIKAMFEQGLLTKAEAVERLRRVMDLPTDL